MFRIYFASILLLATPVFATAGETKKLFDGKSLDGWEGDLKTWRVEDGSIVGGSLENNVPRNEFLCTTKTYGDFELKLKFKLMGDKKSANAGVQFRTKRIPKHHEVSGYQADMGQGYWGALYDESRRNKVLAAPDAKTVAKIVKEGDWNDYTIRAEGASIKLWLNGTLTVDYTEKDDKIERTGIIGLQVHGGGKTKVMYKDIELVELKAKAQGKLDIPPLKVIAGNPRERGLAYGKQFQDGIKHFLDREIYGAFIQKPAPKDEMLSYAKACGQVIHEVCPTIHQEMAGIAEGSGLSLDEVVLISLHEELYHRGVLPKAPHCTAVAVAPPDTSDGHTYVGQTWDWMPSVAGMSSIALWQRGEGPSVLSYGFPGLWTGAGVNSSGIALTWTSANLGDKSLGARVGIPSYALLTHLLYQKDLDSALAEARRNKHAGWFTFVLADGKGRIVNIEGSPQGIVIEEGKERMVRIGFGSREMTKTPPDREVKLHARCDKMLTLLKSTAGKNTLRTMQEYFEEPKHQISVGKGTIDMMVFDTTAKTAYLSRGPNYGVDWREFRFGK